MKARANMLSNINLGVTQVLPVCTTGFDDLSAILLRELANMGGLIDTTLARHSLVRNPTMGQITYAREIIDLTDHMLDFYVMSSDRDQVCSTSNSLLLFSSLLFSLSSPLLFSSLHFTSLFSLLFSPLLFSSLLFACLPPKAP
jgi:hypothetical protein